jgi:hypothetical protein
MDRPRSMYMKDEENAYKSEQHFFLLTWIEVITSKTLPADSIFSRYIAVIIVL